MNNEKEEKYLELVKTLEEYVEFIGSELNKFVVFAHTHGVSSSKENIKKGQQYRDKIRFLKDDINLIDAE